MARLPFSLFKQGTAEYEVKDIEARESIADLSDKIITETVNSDFDASGITYLGRKSGYALVGASINATSDWIENTILTLWNAGGGYITYGLRCQYLDGTNYTAQHIDVKLTWVKL